MKMKVRWGQAGRSLFRLGSLLLLLALCVSVLPRGVSAGSPASPVLQTCKFKHTVEAGDTLTYLGNLYNIDWREIAEANDINEPYVLILGSVLCIPGGTKPSDTTTTTGTEGKEPTLVVVPQGTFIFVTVENFPPKTQYYVRVFPRSGFVSYRIGHFLTNKEGDFSDWFKVPLFIPRTPSMAICVKNVWTDATSCVKYEDEYYPTLFLAAANCAKEGR